MRKGESGSLGERYAAEKLVQAGYEIVCLNYRCRFGEIDIIARDSKYIIFIEVKTRAKNAMVTAFDAIDYKKRAKILKTAKMYIAQNGIELQPRFDVIEVITAKANPFTVSSFNHIKNAFWAEGLDGYI